MTTSDKKLNEDRSFTNTFCKIVEAEPAQYGVTDEEINQRIEDSNPDKGLTFDAIEFYEYECFNACTENGCIGHTTDIPLNITINDVTFWVDGAENGDFPASVSKEEAHHVIKVIAALHTLIRESQTGKA